MKKLYLGLFMGLIMAITVSIGLTQSAPDTNKEQFCGLIGGLAQSVMSHRQGGTSLSRVLEICRSDICKQVALYAYTRPKFATPEYQKRAIQKFGSDVQLECLQELNKEPSI